MLEKSLPLLVTVNKIWDHAPHSALTDLIQWQGAWLIAFREADCHYGGINGIIRLIRSTNGLVWELMATLEIEGWDLRDPKLSITPSGQLMLLVQAMRLNRQRERLTEQSMVAFSSDGALWSDLQKVMEKEWLWRVTWQQGMGYGMAYDASQAEGEWKLAFYRTADGIHYQRGTSFPIKGKPSEATIRFYADGQLVALLRRGDGQDNHAWIGSSVPPYEDWLWNATDIFLGGPNFLILPDGAMWAAGRIFTVTPYGIVEKTALCEMSSFGLHPKLILPSGGDCSYPGMVYEAPYLFMSYYSSHKGKSAIYFAQIQLP